MVVPGPGLVGLEATSRSKWSSWLPLVLVSVLVSKENFEEAYLASFSVSANVQFA